MSFWNGVKRTFGFGNDEEYDDDPAEEYAAPASVIASTEPVTDPSAKTKEDPAAPAADSDLPSDLFDAVLEVFNAAQPDFIAKCVSTEAQKQFLIDSLAEPLRRRIEAAGADREMRVEYETLKERVALLEKENAETEALRAQNNRLRLSIENRTRAMQDRINDLEMHHPETRALAEARSHVEMLEKTVAKLETRLSETEAELEEAKNSPCGEAQPSEKVIEKVVEKEVEVIKENPLDPAVARELHRQTLLREQAEMKSRMADHMVSDMRNRAAQARHDLEQCQAEQEELTVVIEQKISEFETANKQLAERVRELQATLKEERAKDYEARLAKLNEENASLRHTIENNLYDRANAEMRLRQEIKDLRDRLSSPTHLPSLATASEAPDYESGKTDTQAAPRRRGRPKKQRIDPELADTGWFTAPEPEAAAPAKAQPVKDDPDFGYHEPPRRPGNDNAAQLSLF